ncbi:MAG: c-type cytochrome [Rhodoferax sp.]
MSDNSHADDTTHTGPIKSPKQLLITVFFAFVVPIFIMIGIVHYVTSANLLAAGSVNTEKSADSRIQKVGTVEILDAKQAAAALAQQAADAAAAAAAPASGAAVAAATPAALPADAGEKRYKETCFACHGTGAAGAPKFGDKAAWAPRIATGMDTLVAKAISGLNAMPPRGGSNASDAEIKATVIYMVNAAK